MKNLISKLLIVSMVLTQAASSVSIGSLINDVDTFTYKTKNYFDGSNNDTLVSAFSDTDPAFISKPNEDPDPYEYLTVRVDKEEYRACYPFSWHGGGDPDYTAYGRFYFVWDNSRRVYRPQWGGQHPYPTTESPAYGISEHKVWTYYRNCNLVTKYEHFESWADLSNYLSNLRNTASYWEDKQYYNSTSWYDGADYSSYDAYYGITIYGKSKYLKEAKETISKKWLSLGGSGQCGNAYIAYVSSSYRYEGTNGDAFRSGYTASSFDDKLEFIDIQADMGSLRSFDGIFEGSRAKIINIGNNNFSRITDMSKLFKNCSQLEKVIFTPFEAPVCSNMSEMFSGCVNLTDINLKAFDTHYVEDMHDMFKDCKKMINYDFSNFNTEKVISMTGMFQNNTELQELNIGKFNTKSVTSMENMFSGCTKVAWIRATILFDTSGVSDNGLNMFFNCLNIEGEMMTEYNASYIDVNMAKVDRGGHNWGVDNGYFRCGHQYYESAIISSPTCTEEGEYGEWCKDCHERIWGSPIPALGHISSWSVTDPAYCYKTGTYSEICERCGLVLQEVAIGLQPHSTSSYTIDYDATCTKSGIEKLECSVCGVCFDTRPIAIKDHRMPYIDNILEDATCVKYGKKESWCPDCGIFIGTLSIALKPHSFSSWSGDKRSCIVCGYIEKKYSYSGGGSDSYSGTGGLGGNINIDTNKNNLLDNPFDPLNDPNALNNNLYGGLTYEEYMERLKNSKNNSSNKKKSLKDILLGVFNDFKKEKNMDEENDKVSIFDFFSTVYDDFNKNNNIE